MRIVVLDKATLGNDLDFGQLFDEGEVTFYDYTLPENTVERIADADVVVTNKVVIGETELQASPKLKLICVAATGYNNIDVQSAKNHGVIVANVKGYSTESVAQHLFAYLLAVYNSVLPYNQLIKQNLWQSSKIFTMLDYGVEELSGKTLGIAGFGAIGKRVAKIAEAFGMKVLVAKIPGRNYDDNLHKDFEFVLENSDVFTIHAPLSKLTENLITLRELKLMKPSAVLINLARGGIVNENDLFYALSNKIISFAIVDVLTKEPPREGNILFNAPNILLTPHIAWTSKQARRKLLDGIVGNIRKFKNGQIDEICVYKL